MQYWSKGLGRRSALNVDWIGENVQITIENGRQFLSTAVPLTSFKGSLPPDAKQAILAGKTLPPIVLRYTCVLARQDFEDIFSIAMSRKVAGFMAGRPGGRGLIWRLAYLRTVFLLRYLRSWAEDRVRSLGRVANLTESR